MTTTPSETHNPSATAPAERFRYAILYSVEGDLRYLSHHDELRMLIRAFTRAGWPLAYSQGFNPLPRVVLPLPRSVGSASTSELAVFELTEARPVPKLFDSLSEQFPTDCRLLEVYGPLPRSMPHPVRVRYTIELLEADVDQVASRLESLRAAPSLVIEREHGPKKAPSQIDIRPFIEEMELIGNTLAMWFCFVEQRTARPSEVLAAMGLRTADYHHRVCRVTVDWDLALHGGGRTAEYCEGTKVGKEEICNT